MPLLVCIIETPQKESQSFVLPTGPFPMLFLIKLHIIYNFPNSHNEISTHVISHLIDKFY